MKEKGGTRGVESHPLVKREESYYFQESGFMHGSRRSEELNNGGTDYRLGDAGGLRVLTWAKTQHTKGSDHE
jgi:hypothetical protein